MARTSSPSLAKSADNMEGAIRVFWSDVMFLLYVKWAGRFRREHAANDGISTYPNIPHFYVIYRG